MEDDKTFQCVMCGETFQKGWSDEEAMKEYEQNYGAHIGEEMDVVCDECHDAIMVWRKNMDKDKLQ